MLKLKYIFAFAVIFSLTALYAMEDKKKSDELREFISEKIIGKISKTEHGESIVYLAKYKGMINDACILKCEEKKNGDVNCVLFCEDVWDEFPKEFFPFIKEKYNNQ